MLTTRPIRNRTKNRDALSRKVVNRLRQVTAATRQAGENEVAIIHSAADNKPSQRLGQAQAVRPQVVGRALASGESTGLLLNS